MELLRQCVKMNDVQSTCRVLAKRVLRVREKKEGKKGGVGKQEEDEEEEEKKI